MTKTLVLISLAQNQSRFFAALELAFRQAGHDVVHVAFHDGAAAELAAEGRRVFNPFRLPVDGEAISFEAFGIEDPALLLGHEKAAYELRDTQALAAKFRRHLAAMDEIFATLEKEGRSLVVLQELGGFTSVLAACFAARRRRISNLFIEPAFFKGRFFLTLDSFRSPVIPASGNAPGAEVLAALEKIRASQTVVIPVKDRSHYRGAMQKITDPRNIRRLGEKLYEKHVLKRQEEFEHIGGHVSRHLRMLANSIRLKRYYAEIPVDAPFLYYPLHVPADFALTIRSPEYLDQPSLIDYLCRIAPLGHKVVIKEHPALVGSLSASRVDVLMQRHDNLVLLTPTINNHRVLQQATSVVTVNSKAGAEALLYGKPVMALGDSFYRDSGLVTAIDALGDVRTALKAPRAPDPREVERYFGRVWNASLPGELYDLTPANLETFAASVCSFAPLGALWSKEQAIAG